MLHTATADEDADEIWVVLLLYLFGNTFCSVEDGGCLSVV